ncbi:MAG: hypothetical protein U5K71_03400 [Gracilimonas sp.]|nr:hypothetical protein [Gracilimonas sp.]
MVAALAAAIVSSLASMLNSVATIFTMDIYRAYINKNASDKQTVNMGRITAAVALVTAVLIAPFLEDVPQVFQFIQEYTGVVSPGILAVFIMGLFWKKTTTKGAIYGVLSSIVIALLLKLPSLELPFLTQMYYTMILTVVIIAGVSLTTNPEDEDPEAIHTTASMFKTSPAFNIGAYTILIITTALYAMSWYAVKTTIIQNNKNALQCLFVGSYLNGLTAPSPSDRFLLGDTMQDQTIHQTSDPSDGFPI